MSITTQQIRSFEEHGYLTGIDIHDDAHVARIREAFDELEAREGTENWPAVLARGQDRFKNFGEWQLGFA